jgi:hypothetical protein
LFSNPLAITLDTSTSPTRALVADSVLDAVFAVDLNNGDRSVLSNAATGSGTVFDFPSDITLDTSSNPARALVVSFSLKAVFAVDLVTGDRTVLSDQSTGSGPLFSSPLDITLDTSTSPARALVTDSNFVVSRVLAVDLATGDRSVLSDASTGSGTAFVTPRGIELDTSTNPARALVTDLDLGAVFAVDLATGDRSVLSGPGNGTGPTLGRPFDITVDVTNKRAVFIDNGLLMLELSAGTGERAFFSN